MGDDIYDKIRGDIIDIINLMLGGWGDVIDIMGDD